MRRRWQDELRAIAPRLLGTLGTSGAVAVLGVVTGTVAARLLEPSGRGELAQLLLWPQLVATLGTLGIDVAATYTSADAARRRNVPATLLALAAVQSLALVPLYLLLTPLLFGDAAGDGARMMALLIPAYLVGAYSVNALSGRLRFGAFNIVRVALPAVYCSIIVALAATGELSPHTGALAYLIAHGACDGLALVLLIAESGAGRFDDALARHAVGFGVRAHVGRLTPQALGIDVAIIALLLTPHDLGLYAAAAAFLAAPNLVASSMGMVVFPQISAAHQSGERPRVAATFALHTGAIAAIAAALAVFAAPAVTLVFGQEYADSAQVLRLLIVGAVAMAIRHFPLEVLRGMGRPGLTSLAEGANWSICLVALPAGAALGGLTGVAAAVAVAGVCSLAVLSAIVLRSGVLVDDGIPGRDLETAEVAA